MAAPRSSFAYLHQACSTFRRLASINSILDSCPNNSPIDVFRLFHEILVRRLTPMPMSNMDLQGKRMTRHGIQNIRSLDKLLSRSTGFACSVDGGDGLFSRCHVTPGGRDIWP
jgi:hypothetical protein